MGLLNRKQQAVLTAGRDQAARTSVADRLEAHRSSHFTQCCYPDQLRFRSVSFLGEVDLEGAYTVVDGDAVRILLGEMSYHQKRIEFSDVDVTEIIVGLDRVVVTIHDDHAGVTIDDGTPSRWFKVSWGAGTAIAAAIAARTHRTDPLHDAQRI